MNGEESFTKYFPHPPSLPRGVGRNEKLCQRGECSETLSGDVKAAS